MMKKLKENASTVLVLIALVSGCFGALKVFATQAEFQEHVSEYKFDKEKALRKELRETVFECKKLYGPDYSKAPDEFTKKFCRDAEIELEEQD